MKDNLKKYVDEVIAGFQQNKGKGSVYCFPPIDFATLVISLIGQFYNKNPESQVFIVVDEYATRKAILDKMANENLEYNIKVLSADYIKPNYTYDYKLIITVGIVDNFELINFLNSQAKFMLSILTKNIMNTAFINSVRTILPSITTTVTNESVRTDNIYSPVEEYRIGVELSDEDKVFYKKCDEYITTSISIFGDISNIEKCKVGDTYLGISASEVRDNIAKQNGWNIQLDTSVAWSKQIDDIYNPNMLLERATNFYNITKQRRDLLTDNVSKLDAIGKICVDNYPKKILIVSKRGEFAAVITRYLNETFPIKCGDYHDTIDNEIALDEQGNTKLIKSGVNKGKPKTIGAQAISKLNMRRFNDGEINVLSIKNSSNVKLKIAVDMIIFTSSYLDNIIAFKTRFTDVVYNSVPTITYRLYCKGTTENKHLNDQKESTLITVIDDNENIIGFDETNGNIIL